MKSDTIIFWIATGLLVLAVGVGSLADLFQVEAIRESVQRIGFPVYILPLLGMLKLLGTLVVLVPALKRWREAAYAGMVFYFVGATYCHVAVGDGPAGWMPTLIILGVVVVSYVQALKLGRIGQPQP